MRPIDADALKEDLTRFYANEVTARELIDEQPTIDAVPVVRCKDCKYLIQTVYFGIKINVCRRHGSGTILPTARTVTDDWFCADGERWKE